MVTFLYIAWDFLKGDNFVGGNKFLEGNNLGNIFLSSPVISVFWLVNISNLLTYSESFSAFLWLCSIGARGAKDDN